MIVATKEQHLVGEVIPDWVIGCFDADGNEVSTYRQPVRITRVSSLQEWIDDCIPTLGPPPSNFLPPIDHFFYEVESD